MPVQAIVPAAVAAQTLAVSTGGLVLAKGAGTVLVAASGPVGWIIAGGIAAGIAVGVGIYAWQRGKPA